MSLSEIFTIPSIEDTPLPLYDGDSSSDEDVLQFDESHHQNINTDADKSSSESSDSELDFESTHEDVELTDSDDSGEQVRRPGRYTLDPVLKTPKNITPASMDRPVRRKNKPDRFSP